MTPLNHPFYARYAGGLLVLLGLVINPYTVGFYTTDGIIESARTIMAIGLLELMIIICGIFVGYKQWAGSATLAFSLTFLLLLLVITETMVVALNLFVPPDYQERHQLFYGFYQPDPELGYKIKANLTHYKMSWMGQTVTGIYSTDDQGFRNVGRDYAASQHYFIGDSFTFGDWVERPKTFYGLLESNLGAPVISLGVGGYGLAQYRHLVKSRLYPPATKVILGIFANDLQPIPDANYLRNYYTMAGWKAYQSPDYSYKTRSLVTQLIKTVTHQISGTAHNRQYQVLPNGVYLYKNRGANPKYMADSQYIAAEQALLDIIEWVRQHHLSLLIALIPSKESAYSVEYEQFFPGHYLNNEHQGYARISQLASKQGVPCVDLTPLFRNQTKRGQKLYFDQDPHWNEQGHRLAAEGLMPYLGRQ